MGLPDAFLKAMIWWAVLIGVALSKWFLVSSVGEIHSHAEVDANGLFCTQLISTMGYPCEEHQAVTADGFVLAVHRIPYGAMGKQITPTRQPVFLQHGFMGGGDQWVLDSPQQSLAFILADSGFDVWIGNLRCNRWSTGHASLTTQDKKYWEWSWDEHATFDVPAMLQLVFNQTGSRAKYIGHSQGTIIFLAALSQSSVTQFVDGAALLSPIAYLSQVTSILAKTFATIFVDKVYLGLGVKEFDAMD
ncbi:hypothetical protein O6H91_05G121000 [Diphasiastrum complanatum]|uniref:Uncharacterized protein n=1 Tax=Diphasiastrum complanatum TaxID=34168 RepID=A0ACC2DT38_DIPCM|nr:hypothetical protein O6H91_05G121000 [Diphasiastrum complanatum]